MSVASRSLIFEDTFTAGTFCNYDDRNNARARCAMHNARINMYTRIYTRQPPPSVVASRRRRFPRATSTSSHPVYGKTSSASFPDDTILQLDLTVSSSARRTSNRIQMTSRRNIAVVRSKPKILTIVVVVVVDSRDVPLARNSRVFWARFQPNARIGAIARANRSKKGISREIRLEFYRSWKSDRERASRASSDA